jgi:hypothetical protein
MQMKLMIILAAAGLVPASAQVGSMKQAPPASIAAKPAGTIGTADTSPVALPTILSLEKEMDGRISTTGGTDPCQIWGASRGVYVSGIGAIFTAEVELAATPGAAAMFQAITPPMKAKILKNKQAHLPMLEQTVREMALSLAASPALKLADTEQVVVSVRLWYRPWEDKTGLPGQIVARLDRRGGIVKMEVQ